MEEYIPTVKSDLKHIVLSESMDETYAMYAFKVFDLAECDAFKIQNIPSGKIEIEIDLIKPHTLIKNYEMAVRYLKHKKSLYWNYFTHEYSESNPVDSLKSILKVLGAVDFLMIVRTNNHSKN